MSRITIMLIALSAPAMAICGKPARQAQIDHDMFLASALTCGGVLEYRTPMQSAQTRYKFSMQDGAEILTTLGDRVGYGQISHILGTGDDGAWLERQLDAAGTAAPIVQETEYVLGEYARHYCIEHPLSTMADAINNLVDRIKTHKLVGVRKSIP